MRIFVLSFFFFFNDTATTEIYTLSLHDALPILNKCDLVDDAELLDLVELEVRELHQRSEEHTSELQSQSNLVCRLLLEKKKTKLLMRLGIRHALLVIGLCFFLLVVARIVSYTPT